MQKLFVFSCVCVRQCCSYMRCQKYCSVQSVSDCDWTVTNIEAADDSVKAFYQQPVDSHHTTTIRVTKPRNTEIKYT